MRTLHFASVLLASAGNDGSAAGEYNAATLSYEPAPAPGVPTIEEKMAAAESIAEGSDAAAGLRITNNRVEYTLDGSMAAQEYLARVAAERAEFIRIRELTPVQEFEIRPCPGAAHLGLLIGTPEGIRCIPLADWRTERVCLKAGDHLEVVVLAGEGQKNWEFYCAQEARQNARPALGSPEADQAAMPAKDPLEETQPSPAISQAEKGADEASSISSGAGNQAAASESAVGTGS